MIEQLTDTRLTADARYGVLRTEWQRLSWAFDDALLGGDRPGSLDMLARQIGGVQARMRERAIELGVIAR